MVVGADEGENCQAESPPGDHAVTRPVPSEP